MTQFDQIINKPFPLYFSFLLRGEKVEDEARAKSDYHNNN